MAEKDQGDDQYMSTSITEQQLNKWFDFGLNRGSWQATEEIFADGFIYHGSDQDFDLPALRQRIEQYRQSHPDLHFKIDFVTSYANRVGVAWTASTKSTHTKGVGVADFKNGKCTAFYGVMPNL